MAKSKPLPPLEELRAEFDYDPATGFLLHSRSHQNKRWAGKVAGTRANNGYIIVSIKGRKCAAHRLVWYIVTGEDPAEYDIDHIDGCRWNNKISNLRKATKQQNLGNRKGRGAYLQKTTGKYTSKLSHKNKTIYLGTFLTAEEAEAAYREKAVELRGEFTPQEWK